MTRKGDARRRIVLHFVLGIALPSSLLGYLAFRGIQNDQALLERERRDELRSVVSTLESELAVRIAEAEAATGEGPTDVGDATPGHERELRGLAHPLSEATFLLDPSGDVRWTSAPLLFRADDATPLPSAPGAESWNAEMERARTVELRAGDASAALDAYRSLLDRAAGADQHAEALNAIGRSQMKLGRVREAAETYDRLAEEHVRTRLGSGVPAGLAGRSQRADARLAAGDTALAVRDLVELYARLVEGRWSLSRASDAFYSGRIRDALSNLAGSTVGAARVRAGMDDSISVLRERETEARSRTERLLAFQEVAGEVLRGRIEGEGPIDGIGGPVGYHRASVDVGGRQMLVSVQGSQASQGSTGAPSASDRASEPADPATESADLPARPGIVFDRDALRDGVLAPVLTRMAGELGARWSLRDRSGRVLLTSVPAPEERPLVTGGFPGDFPPWTLELSYPSTRPVEAFLTSRRGVYFYVFLLLAGILLFGLLLTVRSVTHELEVARLKSDFVSTVSHEFKSPLTAVRQLSEMLAADRVSSEKKRRQYYEVLVHQSERLSRLVDNVLDVARMETGGLRLDPKPTALGPLVEDVVTAVEDRVAHEGFRIRRHLDEDLPVLSLDPDAFAQALTNLIDNAVKYSGDSRKVEVRAYVEDGEVVVAVEDSGIGLASEDRRRVFERFYRSGNALTRATKGTGLGLTLVQGTMEAHGGRVEVESEPGRGSTFSLHLPVAPDT